MDPKEVNKFMECIVGIYGELRITRGEVHKYLVMALDLLTPGDLRVAILDYLKGVLEDLLEVITWRRTSPEDNNIFQVRPEDEHTIMNEEQETAFQHTVEHMIFVTSRSRKGTNMAIDLLCTQKRIPD